MSSHAFVSAKRGMSRAGEINKHPGRRTRPGRNVAAWGLCLAALLAGSAFGQPANDSCAAPTAISGNGLFAFDLTGAGSDFGLVLCADAFGVDVAGDVWFCWTASCTGVATFSTCGLTNQNTYLAIWDGCSCPQMPGQTAICCDDDFCGLQSSVSCDVVCGRQYLIQVAHKDFGLPGAPGQLRIDCQGDPCDSVGCPAGECCGGAPRFTGFTGPVSVTTTIDLLNATRPQVQVVDLSNASTAPAGVNWATATFAPADPTWLRSSIGNVFGVAIDGDGNIYVAHTSVYGSRYGSIGPIADMLGTGGPGAIYQISTVTGAATPFVTLPNTNDPVIAGLLGPDEAWPGIGNIAIDCGRDTLFATNFDDGRIYRISLASGAVLSAYDHASNAVSAGGAPEAGDPNGFVALGERVWGVEPHNGRVYYTIWGTDYNRAVTPNTVWSIACDSTTGEFLPGTRRQEVLNGVPFDCNQMPYSDISFSPSGTMLLAQRSMGTYSTQPADEADTLTWAHASCLLEFECRDGSSSWDPSGHTFEVGFSGLPHSTAGGVDVDFRTGQPYNVYATGDALTPSLSVYGLQGLPATGGGAASSLLLDLDGFISVPKTQIGSVEVSCVGCATISQETVLCEVDDEGLTGCFTYTFTLTNNSGQTVQYVNIPDLNITPNVVSFPGGLANGASATVTLTICNATPDSVYSIPFILFNTADDVCCDFIQDVVLPDCDCMQWETISVEYDVSGDFSLSIPIQPLEFDVGHVFIVYEPCDPSDPVYNVTVNPTYIPITINQFDVQNVNTYVTGDWPPGATLCFRVFIHTPDFSLCCSEVIEIRTGEGVDGCPEDLNGDGVIDLLDLSILLSNFGSSGLGDFNGDGVIDLNDLSQLLTKFGTSCHSNR